MCLDGNDLQGRRVHVWVRSHLHLACEAAKRRSREKCGRLEPCGGGASHDPLPQISPLFCEVIRDEGAHRHAHRLHTRSHATRRAPLLLTAWPLPHQHQRDDNERGRRAGGGRRGDDAGQQRGRAGHHPPVATEADAGVLQHVSGAQPPADHGADAGEEGRRGGRSRKPQRCPKAPKEPWLVHLPACVFAGRRRKPPCQLLSGVVRRSLNAHVLDFLARRLPNGLCRLPAAPLRLPLAGGPCAQGGTSLSDSPVWLLGTWYGVRDNDTQRSSLGPEVGKTVRGRHAGPGRGRGTGTWR